jgi:fumarate reductase subunit C
MALDIETPLSAKAASYMSWDIQSIPDSGVEKCTFRGYLSFSTSPLIVVVVVIIIIIIFYKSDTLPVSE